jgi:ribosome-binding protein aMBF1 (putative translation factor)
MNTKLTLTLEKEVIEIAKEYAKEKGQSLSELVENYFKLITVNRRQLKSEQLSPRIQRLRGIIKADETLDYKKILSEELSKKYGI